MVFLCLYIYIHEWMWFSQMERTNEFFTIFTRDFKSNYRVGSFSFYGTYIDWSSTNIMEVFLGDKLDQLNQLKKPTKIEREIKTIKKIITHPNRVYGHGLISIKEFEKVITRLEVLEEKVKQLRIHTNTNDNMDLLE